MKPVIKLSISSCPNDTFMFDALLHNRLSEEIPFDISLTISDIEELNKAALTGFPDITKISYALYPLIADEYMLLDSGSALGYGNGPLLVSKHKIYPDEVKSVRIAIPGVHTTASLLLDHAFGKGLDKRPYLFSDIADVVCDGEADAGVLIHEQRFTYADKGLSLVADLGSMWEKSTSLPIPLGAIAVRRSLGEEFIAIADRLLHDSIRHAFDNPSDSHAFVKENAKEMSDEVCGKHIAMFVNDFSLSLGEDGRKAVTELLSAGGLQNRDDIWLKRR